jgi:hypothetical protein
MKVSIVSYQVNQESTEIKLFVSINDRLQVFQGQVEIVSIGDKQLQVANIESAFWQEVPYGGETELKIGKFIIEIYNGRSVELPVSLVETK